MALGLEPLLTVGKFQAKSGYNYSYLFYYEKDFFNNQFVRDKKIWMHENWNLSIVFAVVYIVAVFAGQAYMKNRPKYDLRPALISWNFFLAVFSIMGTVRFWPEFVYTLTHKGVEHSVCNPDYTHGVTGCWAWLFILSKVPELFDTLFIVLRKQELIFLHWYHHATVLIYCWFSSKDFSASGRWFVLMNYTVHAFMYSYYAFRAMRFKIPKWVNIAITSGQISQMIFGIYVNCLAYMKKRRGEACDVTDENITWSFIMYFSYFLLFFHFFYNAYISPSKKTPRTQSQLNGNGVKKPANGVNGHHDQNNNSKDKKSN